MTDDRSTKVEEVCLTTTKFGTLTISCDHGNLYRRR